MSDGSSIRLKCPLCAAEVVAQQGQVGQVITCDFCLEEFTAPAPTAQTKPTAPSDGADELPNQLDDPVSSGANSADLRDFDLSEVADSDFGLADDLPGTTAQSGPERDGPSPGGDPTGLSDEQWLRVDEDLTTPDEDHPAKKVALTSDYEFSGPCPLCATRFVATDDQIGTMLRCPDCHTEFEICEPLPGARQPRRQSSDSWDDDDDFKLSEPDIPTDVESPTDDPLGSPGQSFRPMPTATSWPRDEMGADGQTAVADAVLRKAEAEVEEQEAKQTDLQGNPLTNGVLNCFLDPSLLIRWLVFAIAIQIELSAFEGAIERAMMNNAGAQIMSMMMGSFAFLFGIGLFVCGSVTLLTITQETAIGRDRIESWPGADFMDWAYEALYVVCALFACLIVGGLVGQVFLAFGLVVYVWGLIATISLSGVIVFPIYLLATLETGLAVNPASGPVLHSLSVARGTWIQFAFMSLGLAIIAVLGCLLRYAESAILNFVAAAVLFGILMLYFRLLGRLAWTCQEAVGDDQRLREAAS
ncbi:MAG: hypothetical protein CMJ50_00450 [Planctomycetaceae bacterium]|nr:hypothetical protein [Planctomycetaceae bacterium]